MKKESGFWPNSLYFGAPEELNLGVGNAVLILSDSRLAKVENFPFKHM